MQKKINYELWVGCFVLIGILALLFLALKVVNVQSFSESKSYRIEATFNDIGGLKVLSPVKTGGVVVGRVSDITLDAETLLPKVIIRIDERFNKIPETSSLSIKTAGLLGEQYLALSIGFDDGEVAMLKDGDRIYNTTSAMVLEDLIGQFLYSDKSK